MPAPLTPKQSVPFCYYCSLVDVSLQYVYIPRSSRDEFYCYCLGSFCLLFYKWTNERVNEMWLIKHSLSRLVDFHNNKHFVAHRCSRQTHNKQGFVLAGKRAKQKVIFRLSRVIISKYSIPFR